MEDPRWASEELDIEHPSPARAYDYHLGDSRNFTVDNWPELPPHLLSGGTMSATTDPVPPAAHGNVVKLVSSVSETGHYITVYFSSGPDAERLVLAGILTFNIARDFDTWQALVASLVAGKDAGLFNDVIIIHDLEEILDAHQAAPE